MKCYCCTTSREDISSRWYIHHIVGKQCTITFFHSTHVHSFHNRHEFFLSRYASKFINYKDFITNDHEYSVYMWSWLCNEKHKSVHVFTSLQGFKKLDSGKHSIWQVFWMPEIFCTYISYDSWHVMNFYFMKLESENKYCTQTCTIVLKNCFMYDISLSSELPFITYLHKSYICMYISHIVIHHMCRGSPPPLLLLSKYLVSFWRRWQ